MSANPIADLAEALTAAEASSYAGIPQLVAAAEAVVRAEQVGHVLVIPPKRHPAEADTAVLLARRVVDRRFVRDWSGPTGGPDRSPEKVAELADRDAAARTLLTDESAAGSAGHLAREIRSLVTNYDTALRTVIQEHAYRLRMLHEHGDIEARTGFSLADGEARRIDRIPERVHAILDTVTAWANIQKDQEAAR